MTRAPSDRKPAKKAKPATRAERLAAALRENLRRRKEQQRGRGAEPDKPADSPPRPGKT